MSRRISVSACVAAALAVGACSSSSGTGGSSGSQVDAGTDGGTTGGGTSESVQGLELPSKFSVLSAKDDSGGETASKPQATTSSKSVSGTLSFGDQSLKAFDDTDTAYSQDEADVYVYDSSMESLNTINEIVCMMSQTAASQMVNEGAYVALVDEERCQQGQAPQGGQNSQQSGGDGVDYSRWVVESTREDNESPQEVRIWLPDPGDGDGNGMGPQTILVDLTATEGKSDDLPFGSFSMSFKGVASQDSFEIVTMRGMLETVENDDNAPQFRFVNIGGDEVDSGQQMGWGFKQAANVRLGDAQGNSGLGVTMNSESYETPEGVTESSQRSYAVDYDADYFRSSRDINGDGTGDEQVCRAREQFDTRAWRYGLYHLEDGQFRGRDVAAGERVALSSGFPFVYDSNGDGLGDADGWIGYHGVWTESGQALEDGQSIERYDYESEQTTPYTVRVAPGRLKRRTAHQGPLGDFVGDEFLYWGAHPDLELHDEWLVTVAENLSFSVLGRVEWTEEGRVIHDTVDDDGDPNTAEVSAKTTWTPADNETLWMWSDSLGGEVVYTHDASAADADRSVRYYAEENVTGTESDLFPSGQTELALYCYQDCLRGGLTQKDVDAAQFPDDIYHPYEGQALEYTLKRANGSVTLLDEQAEGAEVSAVGLSLESLGHEWGIMTGAMVSERLSNEDQPWTVYDQSESFIWETGPNEWNRMTTAVDQAGAPVEFDRPLEFAYVHSTENDANGSDSHDGKRFMLHYGGFGDLGGFPWADEGNRSYPAVTLADGVVLDERFVVKALEKEQSMQDVALEQCEGLDAEAAFANDAITLPEASEIGDVPFTLDDRPSVDGAPAVIDGEVQ